MRVLNGFNINRNLSLEYPKRYEVEVIKGGCYFVVLEIISKIYANKEFDLFEKLKVAFGYFGNTNVVMNRHCFILYNDEEIIDPTCPHTEDEWEYHIIKTFDLIEYGKIYKNFFNADREDYTPAFKGLPEEREYCNYLINNKIRINVTDFEFVEPFDVDRDNTHCVNTKIDSIIDENIDLYHNTAGKPLYFEDINKLEIGEVFWAWVIMDGDLCTCLSVKEVDHILFKIIDFPMTLNGFYKEAGLDIYDNNKKIYGQRYLG